MKIHALVMTAALVCSGAAQAAMLAPGQIDGAHLLPPPPAAASQQARDEMAELKAIAARSTPDQIAFAARDAKDEHPDMFNSALGFDIGKYPVTSALLNSVAEEEEADSKPAKNYFHRMRPYAADKSLKTCVPVKPGKSIYSSYPSGHATLAFAMAEVLAALIPDKAQAILARASQFAENRLVCSVHYRSDIAAGQQFGTIMALRLMDLPAFQTKMDAARAELRAARVIR